MQKKIEEEKTKKSNGIAGNYAVCEYDSIYVLILFSSEIVIICFVFLVRVSIIEMHRNG